MWGVVGKERGGWTGRLGLGPQHARVLGPGMSCALPWLSGASALTPAASLAHTQPIRRRSLGRPHAQHSSSNLLASTFQKFCPPSSMRPVCRPAALLVSPPCQVLVYGEKLDLGPFMAAGAMDDGPATYTLTGVVVHLDQVWGGAVLT